MRKVRKNIATRQVIHIVGEGLTELFYFSHLKKFLGYRYSISPRLFENNSIEKIDKKIKELLNEDVFVICVFDADVSRRSDAENRKMAALKKKYEKNGNVILCDSLQSIEYWFLLHFEDTCRHFLDSAATERALKRYLPTYGKTRKYLEKDSWLRRSGNPRRRPFPQQRGSSAYIAVSFSWLLSVKMLRLRPASRS